MNKRTMISELAQQVGSKATISGWVHVRRDHGKLAFFEIRDRTGLVQAVYFRAGAELDTLVDTLRPEFVIEASGLVKARPEKMINPEHPTGTIEFEIEQLKVLSKAETPPFEITETSENLSENIRMQYRYLDIRRAQMQANLRFRHKLIKAFRDYLDGKDFIEVETPILAKSSPEGARDFIVPSRITAGSAYALPQAPQQFKQLLMIAGYERYYQIARCFRDEDLRNDRQPEFTQLDLEMSFVDQEDILNLSEEMMATVVKQLMPDKTLPATFTRLSYAESMEKYGTDKPDLRANPDDPNELAFAWVIDFPLFEKTPEGHITYAHNPFAQPHADDIHLLDSGDEADLLKIRAYSFDLVLNGYEISSGSIRINDPELQRSIFKRYGLSEDEIESRFGDFLKAFNYGTPPHGGLAPGLDRLAMVLLGEQSIREVIAFPKTGDMRDLMLKSPGPIGPKAMRELGLKQDDSKA